MNSRGPQVLLATDIGNTSIEIVAFDLLKINEVIAAGSRAEGDWPEPLGNFGTAAAEPDFESLDAWLGELAQSCNTKNPDWRLASVNEPAAASLEKWLKKSDHTPGRVTLLQHTDFSLPLKVKHPEQVGPDRLAAAAGANWFRTPDHAAIVIDTGTAVTIDLVSADGAFQGGTIQPGLDLSFAALESSTDRLPAVHLGSDTTPTVVGKSTEQAIRSGVFWGHIGAIEEIVRHIESSITDPCDITITGGNAQLVLPHLSREPRYISNLIHIGICLGNQS